MNKSLLSRLAAFGAAFSLLTAPALGDGFSVPFNPSSVSTLGGNCTAQGSIMFQSAGGISKCLGAGANGQVVKSGGAGADIGWYTPTGTGTVTSVGVTAPARLTVTGSPITAAGTIALTDANETANTFFAAPNGSTGTPLFRILAAADIPTGVAITSMGSQTANTFLAAPNGSSGVPAFRALASADIPASAVANAQLANAPAYTLKGNATGAAAAPADFTIQSVTGAATLSGTDTFLQNNVSASGMRSAQLSQLQTFIASFTPSGGVTQSLQARASQQVLLSDYASGSSQTTTGTATGGASALTLAAAIDFANGQGIRIDGAGSAPALTGPTSPSAAVVGATGSTTYNYKIAGIDASCGMTSPVALSSITTGNATFSPTNYNSVTFTPGTMPNYVLWRQIGAGAWAVAAVGNSSPILDKGLTLNWPIDCIPSTPLGVAQNDFFVTSILSGGGTTAITTAANIPSSVAGAKIFHDDTTALNLAFSSNATLGANIIAPCGTYNTSGAWGPTTTTAPIGITGSGQCTKFQRFGGNNGFTAIGVSYASQLNGIFLNNVYMPEYNAYSGDAIYTKWLTKADVSNVVVDHPPYGIYANENNDVRMAHDRIFNNWGQGSFKLYLTTGAVNANCCYYIVDVYGQGTGPNTGLGDWGSDKTAYIINGDVQTVYSDGWATSNDAGKCWIVYNSTGNPSNPQFLQNSKMSCEYSNDRNVDLVVGQFFTSTDHTLSAAFNADCFMAESGFTGVLLRNGNVSNCGQDGVHLLGTDAIIQGNWIYNNSATNEGGTTNISSGIVLDSTSSQTTVSGNVIGKSGGVAWSQAYPILTVAGSTYWSVTDNSIGTGNTNNYVSLGAGISATQVLANNSGKQPVSIGSGFGTSPSITAQNGYEHFALNVGTGGSATTGVVTLPLAVNGWFCTATDVTTQSAAVSLTKQVGAGGTTSVTLGNYTDVSASGPWAAGDILHVSCNPN